MGEMGGLGEKQIPVDDPAVHVRPKVELANVAVLEDGLVARVGGVMRRHVVDRAARGEGDPSLEGWGRGENEVQTKHPKRVSRLSIQSGFR